MCARRKSPAAGWWDAVAAGFSTTPTPGNAFASSAGKTELVVGITRRVGSNASTTMMRTLRGTWPRVGTNWFAVPDVGSWPRASPDTIPFHDGERSAQLIPTGRSWKERTVDNSPGRRSYFAHSRVSSRMNVQAAPPARSGPRSTARRSRSSTRRSCRTGSRPRGSRPSRMRLTRSVRCSCAGRR